MQKNDDTQKPLSTEAQVLKDYIQKNFKNASEFSEKFGLRSNNIYSVLKGTRGLDKGQMVNICEKVGYDIFNDKPLATNVEFIPELSFSLSAGGGKNIVEQKIVGHRPIDAKDLQFKKLNTKNLCIIPVKGDSMYPMFTDKEMVVIDTSYQKPIHNQIMAVTLGDESYIKRIIIDEESKTIWLHSENTALDLKDIPVNPKVDMFKVIGKPVFSLYREFKDIA